MTILNETPQFKRGKDVEAWLDKFFRRRGWTITQTTPYEERVLCLGDRRFYKYGRCMMVEYKSGIQTEATGNLFLETVSVDSADKPGWVYTCKADILFYAALLNHKILVFRPERLRRQIPALKIKFPAKATSHHQNDSYNTHGLLVPLDYAVAWLAERVIAV